MEDDSRKLMMLNIALHRNSNGTIPWKLVPTPLGIITTVYQVHGDASSPPLKAACMIATTFSHFLGSGFSSCFSALCHILRCLGLISEGPPARCRQIRVTALAISYSSRIVSSSGKGGTYPVFTVVMVIYHYVERIQKILVTTIFLYNIYDHYYILSR